MFQYQTTCFCNQLHVCTQLHISVPNYMFLNTTACLCTQLHVFLPTIVFLVAKQDLIILCLGRLSSFFFLILIWNEIAFAGFWDFFQFCISLLYFSVVWHEITFYVVLECWKISNMTCVLLDNLVFYWPQWPAKEGLQSLIFLICYFLVNRFTDSFFVLV